MKKCSKCHITKPYQEFGKVSKNKDGYNGKCKLCKREYNNKFHENRSSNKKLLKYYRQKDRLDEIRKFLSDYLNDKVCNHCGDGRKVVLEFHHLRDKNFNLADATKKSIGTIIREIEKCEILCANCHRIVTAEERGYYRELFEK